MLRCLCRRAAAVDLHRWNELGFGGVAACAASLRVGGFVHGRRFGGRGFAAGALSGSAGGMLAPGTGDR
ncbi:hypothetical protein, partial [Rhodococcus sp. A14]|uniref:hypothetical protein n=1 Tax=Rhodococcus sp. A14 TaxID=1194106 RepID=UPI00197DED11